MRLSLRENQRTAIDISIKNNFKSGVHFHATGTGKSWISLSIVLEFIKRNPQSNILWLCEQKFILKEQFNKNNIKKKGYGDIYKKFIVLDYSTMKKKKWYDLVNSCMIWKKPIFLIINRSYLVNENNYEKLKLNFKLIIHDECHSISNNTTKKFYDYIFSSRKSNKTNDVRCIGFSATPNLNIKPYKEILSSYTIYDAFMDNIIVNPKICWVKSEYRLTDIDKINIVKKLIENLIYKKIIVWCGMIKNCYYLSKIWKKYFPNFNISIDTSELKSNHNNKSSFYDYKKFSGDSCNSILFCASKHREGSDIKNLDCCVFLDGVRDRNGKTFIQCLGRVLRKDNSEIPNNKKKQYGLAIDFNAKSCINICDRLGPYLPKTLSDKIFLWKKSSEIFPLEHNKKIFINKISFRKINEIPDKNNAISAEQKEVNLDIISLKKRFVRKIPENDIYEKRLEKEFEIINRKNLMGYFIRAVEILEMTNYIPHVTRGSCGSSLVCYLLGISNIDPIKMNIRFERFLNEYRGTLPDIDFDFPHYLRDEVFLKLEQKYPGQVARISNHVHWHEKSALREAIRRIGIRKKIDKNKINIFLKSLSPDKQKKIKSIKNNLLNEFRHYSLHCGGIVFFHEGIPNDLLLGDGKTIKQISLDKREISKMKKFKIDILSSRGISQLISSQNNKNIDFTDCPYDKDTYDLLCSGKNIGITLAESPLMRKALMIIQPRSIEDIALCLAVIRPAAKTAKLNISRTDNIDLRNEFVYDDDAITILAESLDISFDLADKYRRCISKNKWDIETKKSFDNHISELGKDSKKAILKKLVNLRKYSFCKSHSYSYAQLVFKIAYQKVHNPVMFWKSTLKNIKSSYKKWVHIYEASREGVFINNEFNYENISIYAENRRKKFFGKNIYEQMNSFGYWDMKKCEFFPGCYLKNINNSDYEYSGLVASSKILNYYSFPKKTFPKEINKLKNKTKNRNSKYSDYYEKTKHNKTHDSSYVLFFICVSPGKYIEIVRTNITDTHKNILLKGKAKCIDSKLQIYEEIH